MKTVSGASGMVALFTADGGPGQQKWWSMRLRGTRSGADAVAVIKVNGKDVKRCKRTHADQRHGRRAPADGQRPRPASRPGMCVKAQVFGSMDLLQFSANVDTEEVT
jgi:hypothetical protein